MEQNATWNILVKNTVGFHRLTANNHDKFCSSSTMCKNKVSISYFSVFCFHTTDLGKCSKCIMKFTPHSCQLVLQTWLLQWCTSMVAEFLDTVQFHTPNLFSKVHDYTLVFLKHERYSIFWSFRYYTPCQWQQNQLHSGQTIATSSCFTKYVSSLV